MDSIQPKSYSYALYSTKDDPECQFPIKNVVAEVPPKSPDTFGATKQASEELKKNYRAQRKQFRSSLYPDIFSEKYLNNHCETITPNALIVMENYDTVIAAHIHQLKHLILANIKGFNQTNTERVIPEGRLHGRVILTDGADGHSDMKIISSCTSRQHPDHGLTYDCTILKLEVETQDKTSMDLDLLELPVQEDNTGAMSGDSDDENILSQAMSVSSLNETHSSFAFSSQQSSRTGKDDDQDKSTMEVDNGYTTIYEEKNPNSVMVSRPLCRGHLGKKRRTKPSKMGM